MLPAHRYLEQFNIAFRALTFPPTTPKGAANVAITLGMREHQAIKTLIFKTDKEECVLVMAGGDQNVVSSNLKKAVGSRNISLASPEEVMKTTGYQIGSIPPFSWQPLGFRSFLDAEMMAESVLAVGAGTWGNEILITPGDLVKASNASVVNLTVREKPIFP
jgi:Cys-tRNA(Pro)/Cys-tRNA(Cys) deacylase